MASVAPKRLTGPQRRALIEDAAARLFAERGYAATTVGDIVTAAGVTKPMLYRHFESKKELHLALLAKHRDELAARPLDVYIQTGGTLETLVPAMIDAWFTYVREHPDGSRMLFRDATGDPEIEAFQQELRRRQRAADMALIRENVPEIPEAELEPLGEIVRSSLTGLALWWLDHPDVPQSVPVDAITRMVLAIIRSWD